MSEFLPGRNDEDGISRSVRIGILGLVVTLCSGVFWMGLAHYRAEQRALAVAMDSEAPAKREQVAAVYQRQEEEAPAAESRAPRPPETATTAPKPKAATAPQPKVSAPPSGKIALNTATVSELEGLPGIGPSLAGKIVAYRTQHGPFKRIEDLEKVSGIGPKLLERLRPYLVL